MSIFVGLGGSARNACVALCTEQKILGICEQERITRVRAAGFNTTGVPDEALDALLRRSGFRRTDVATYAVAEDGTPSLPLAYERFDHHFAHAAAAFLPSPFDSAVVVVCDHDSPEVSVWRGSGHDISRLDYPWEGPGFAHLYSQCAAALGFTGVGYEQRMEALARLNPGSPDERVEHLFDFDENRIRVLPNWLERLEGWARGVDHQRKAALAASLQSRIAHLLLEFIAKVKERFATVNHLCVGGSLFYNSYFNSRLRLAAGFDEVFVPINPGNAGLAVGLALHVSRQPRHSIGPFLGPSFNSEEIKSTLDNCKLTYEWASDADRVSIAADALRKGRLVAFFEGPMEWGPRALGARSILANPFAPYALDNLNRFLKHREIWRGYALSGFEATVRRYFAGPSRSPFMECDYAPEDRGRFREILPGPNANVRVQTVGVDAPSQFRALLEAFGGGTGVPMLVNTSFNGFNEPIVCGPRDAIRVFFGTGLDLLVLGEFTISK